MKDIGDEKKKQAGELEFVASLAADDLSTEIKEDADVQDIETFDPENPNWSEEELEEIKNGLNWRLGVTIRSISIGIITGIICTFMLLKILLWNSASTPGWSLPAVLISYIIIKLFVKIASRWTEILPLSKYELVVIQTVTVAITSVSLGMGYGTYMAAIQPNSAANYAGYTYQQVLADPTIFDKLPYKVVDTSYITLAAWALCLSFTSVNLVTVLRKTFIVRYRLPFPSPSATAVLISSFTEKQSEERDLKIKAFIKYGGLFFLWAFISWLFAGQAYYADSGISGCSAFALPIFGLAAMRYEWFVNFNAENLMYSGIAFLTPRVVNFSTIVGSVVFYGILYPIIYTKGYAVDNAGDEIPEGYWFAYGGGTNYYSGMGGYAVFFMICCVLGNGAYIVIDMLKVTIVSFIEKHNQSEENFFDGLSNAEIREEHLRTKIMEESTINKWFLIAAFLISCIAGVVVIPFLFPIKWYFVLVGYIIFPLIAVINVYLVGLTDQGITFLIAKGLIFAFGGWIHSAMGDYEAFPTLMIFLGVVAFGSQNSADIMGDYKTAYNLKASSTSMYIAEMIGLVVGCFISPAIWLLFYRSSPDMGFDTSAFPVNYAPAYIGVGHIALDGFDALPEKATTFGIVFFICAFLSEPLKDYVLLKIFKTGRISKFIQDFWPNWMVMGLYAYLDPGDYALPTVLGWLFCEYWTYKDRESANRLKYIVGSAIIVGVTIFGVPQSFLGLASVSSPMCMTAWPTSDGSLMESSNDIFDLTYY